MDILIHYHFVTVEAMLLVMILNIFVPMALKADPAKTILFSRIGYFAFWGTWSMALFSGLIVFLFTRHTLTPSVTSMLVLSLLLPFLDTYRAVKSRKMWMKNMDALPFSFRILMLELSATLLVVYISKV